MEPLHSCYWRSILMTSGASSPGCTVARQRVHYSQLCPSTPPIHRMSRSPYLILQVAIAGMSYLLSASNPAGNVIKVDPPLNLGDGSANAPAGAPQLPNLLSSYPVRPSWNVAGVDYYVGVPAGTVLKNPATISMAGVSVDTSNHVVTITGDNVTLDGYDFSLNGGWKVDVASGNNITIKNCNFEVGTNLKQPIYVDTPASNVTIKNNIINGAGLKNAYIGYGLIDASGTGTTTIEYNLIENAYSEDIVYDSQSGTNNSLVLQHNLITNAGMGVSAGAHGDWIQLYAGSGSAISNVQINYNTWVQNIPASQAITQGLSLQSANIAQGPVLSESVTNNTMAISAPGTVTYAIIADQTNLNGTATVSNNYIDPTGIQYGWSAFGSFNGPGQPGTGPYNGTVTTLNNVNLVTGTYFMNRPR